MEKEIKLPLKHQQVSKILSKLPYKSQLSTIKSIKKRNSAFTALDKEDAKKEIAIEMIKTLCYTLVLPSNQFTNGRYWNQYLLNKTYIDAFRGEKTSPSNLQKTLLKIQAPDSIETKNCRVCAIGLSTLCKIRLGNNTDMESRIDNPSDFDMEDYKRIEELELDGDINANFKVDTITQNSYPFTKGELKSMEHIYECGKIPYLNNTSSNMLNIALCILTEVDMLKIVEEDNENIPDLLKEYNLRNLGEALDNISHQYINN